LTSSTNFLPAERRAVIALALIYALRMLGLFIILPVFALYAAGLPGGDNKTLVGLALGAYGLTQALLQIPFGWWSDRTGRKPVIYVGLLLLALGSAVAALASSLYVMLIGRILQGGGAISGAVLALNADLTRDVVRTKSMALIGASIGLTFVASIALAPVLTRWIGVPGIFWMIAALALLGAALVKFLVPTPQAEVAHAETQARFADFSRILKLGDLLRLYFGIFVLHAVLTALFLVVPFRLLEWKLELGQHWQVYLPIMIISTLCMWPLIAAGNRGGTLKRVVIGSIALLSVAQLLLAASGHNFWLLMLGLVVFFTAFNALEATLPSLISRVVPASMKGTALGIYGCVQALGPALGAVIAGYLWQSYGVQAVFVFCVALSLLWLVIALPMRAPATASSAVAGGAAR
jgi:MFS family permease